MKKILLLISSTLFLSATLCQAQTRSKADQLVEEGVAFYEDDDYDEALSKLKKALDLDKNNVDAYYEMAQVYLAKKELLKALESCKSAVNLKPDEATLLQTYIVMGNVYDAMENHAEAVKTYDIALKLSPYNHKLFYNKAMSYFRAGQYDRSEETFQSALMVNPLDVTVNHEFAKFLLSTGQKMKALMVLLHYFDLERSTRRAKTNAIRIEQLLCGQYVASDDIVTVENKPEPVAMYKTMENDLKQQCKALKMDTSAHLNRQQYLARIIGGFVDVMVKSSTSQSDFYAKYFGPYYTDLQAKNYSGVMSYILLKSMREEEGLKWITTHETEMQTYRSWNINYKWVRSVN